MAGQKSKSLIVVAVAAALGLGALVLVAYNTYVLPMSALKKDLDKVEEELDAKQLELQEFYKRKRKLERARVASFPTSAVWQKQYDTYLRTKLAKDLKDQDVRPMNTADMTPRKGQPNQIVRAWSVSGKGSWQQIVALLEEFQKTPLMHRIKHLDISRPTAGDADKDKDYTDELSVHLTIETLSLLGKDKRPEVLWERADGRLSTIDAVAETARAVGLMGALGQIGGNGWTMVWARQVPQPREMQRDDYYKLKDSNPFKGGDYTPPIVKKVRNPKAIDVRKFVKLVKIEESPEIVKVVVLPAGSTRGVELSPQEKKLFDLVNAERQKKFDFVAGQKRYRAPVRVNPALFQMAREQAENMARQNRADSYLDDRSPQSRLREAGGKSLQKLEEIVVRMPAATAPEAVVQKWLDSKEMTDKMVSNAANEIGLGWAVAEDGQVYCAMELCARPSTKVQLPGAFFPVDAEVLRFEVGEPVTLVLDPKGSSQVMVDMITAKLQDRRGDLIDSIWPAAKGLKASIRPGDDKLLPNDGNLFVTADRSVPPGTYEITVKRKRAVFAGISKGFTTFDDTVRTVSLRTGYESFLFKSEEETDHAQGKVIHIGEREVYFTSGKDDKIYRIESGESIQQALFVRGEIKAEQFDWWAPAGIVGVLGSPGAGPLLFGSLLDPARPGLRNFAEAIDFGELNNENNRKGD